MDPHIGLDPNDHSLAWAALAMLVVPTAYLLAAIMTGRAVSLRNRAPSLARRLCVSSMCTLGVAWACVVPLGSYIAGLLLTIGHGVVSIVTLAIASGWLFVMPSRAKS